MSTVHGSHGHHHHHHGWDWGGNDTITHGSGLDTVFEHGQASIQGLFGQVTSAGGAFQVIHDQVELSGKATLLGGNFSAEFVSTGKTLMQGGLASATDTLPGGVQHDALAGSVASHSVFEFLSKDSTKHVITNFVAGHDHLYVQGSFAQLQQPHQISSVGGHTIIKLDGGSTTIELKGLSDLTHKSS